MRLIEGITLFDIIGTPSARGDVLFVPALFEFNENEFGDFESFYEEEAASDGITEDSGESKPRFQSLWYRARISAIFSLDHPRQSEWNELLFEFPFLAIVNPERTPRLTTIPFVCVGEYDAYLQFRATESLTNRQTVNFLFHELLHSQPIHLRPFEAILYDCCDGSTYRVGYDQFGFYADDWWRMDEDCIDHDAADPIDRCPDCDGTPEYPLSPQIARCETCDGHGTLPEAQAITCLAYRGPNLSL